MVSPVKMAAEDLSVWFGDVSALKNVDLEIAANRILSIIGPANSGKTTFLRSLNRLNDSEPGVRFGGRVLFDGKDIHRDFDPVALRRKVGIIFALPMPLPISVFENVVYGPRRLGIRGKAELARLAEKALRDAYLWDEIRDRLDEAAMTLSGGQQQRLCIARTLALKPDVILFDEPCSALDPISTAKIEEAMHMLKKEYTIVLVTNNTKQAARVGDETAFFLMGEVIEKDVTRKIFTTPKDKRTEDYISGRFG